jgi:membrane-associated phospholipid phosphatase
MAGVARRSMSPPAAAPRPPVPRPLLPAAARPAAVAALIACVAVTAALGALVSHGDRPRWLDAAVDSRVRASLGGHSRLLSYVALPGTPIPVIVMTAALVVACLATRRWRGAALVAVAVPAAEAVTELMLKHLIGRTLYGGLSYPSGHATSAFVLAAAATVLLTGPLQPRLAAPVRLLLALAALLVAAAVAVAVIGLGFHYFTDTVGGAAVAIGTVLATALLLDKLVPPRPLPGPARPPDPAADREFPPPEDALQA